MVQKDGLQMYPLINEGQSTPILFYSLYATNIPANVQFA